jgi:hypothetical protein
MNRHRIGNVRSQLRIEILESRDLPSGLGLAATDRIWVGNIDNPYLPFIPGTTFYYQGTKDNLPEQIITQVTHQTKLIAGVTTTVVHDTGIVNGKLQEYTDDWYAQDASGNVWYFGEFTSDFSGGKVSHAGSWEAGVNGAIPGIVMLASNAIGITYRQEYAKGVAQDMATVVSLHKTVTVPYGSFDHCLQTLEFSPLEPGALETKYYAPGVGYVKNISLKGGQEEIGLVTVTNGNASDAAVVGPVLTPDAVGTLAVGAGHLTGNSPASAALVGHSSFLANQANAVGQTGIPADWANHSGGGKSDTSVHLNASASRGADSSGWHALDPKQLDGLFAMDGNES